MPTALTADRPVRWGILGAGRIAATVGADIAASSDSEVVAVGARSLDRAAALAGQLKADRSYGSYAELVGDPDVDVIYVATTHAQHHEHALLALRAGKPVLVEKAFTLNARQAREVLAEAEARDLFCMEAMWMSCNPLVRAARAIAASGELGELLSVTADHGQRFDFDPSNRLYDLAAGGGALLDLGVYSATFAWLFLGAPDRVQTTGALSPTGSDTTTAMQWSYDNPAKNPGRFAHVSSTTLSRTPTTGLVVGTDGWLQLSGPFYRPDTMVVTVGGNQRTEHSQLPGNKYGPQVSEVESCLRAGRRQSALVPWSDTLGVMTIMDAARAALGVRYPADRD